MTIFEVLHNFTDIIIVLMLLRFVTLKTKRLKLNFIGVVFYIFIILSFFSFLFSQASFFAYFIKMWVLARYMILAYVVYNINIDRTTFNHILKLVRISFYIQVLVGSLQLLDIQLINDIFIPRVGFSEGSNWYLKGETDIAGTFRFTVFYGYFILSSFVLLFSFRKGKKEKVLLIILAVIFSYVSGSRIALLGVVIFILQNLYYKNRGIFYMGIVTVLFFLIFNGWSVNKRVDNVGSVSGLFSTNYYDASSKFGRVGIFRVIPLFFEAKPKEVLIGFSHDEKELTTFLYKYFNVLPAILRNNVAIGIEDVYWIAQLCYYGIVGFLLFIIFYLKLIFKINKRLKQENFNENKRLLKAVKYLLLIGVISGFVNQSLSIKSFSFFMWLSLGLIMNLTASRKISKRIKRH